MRLRWWDGARLRVLGKPISSLAKSLPLRRADYRDGQKYDRAISSVSCPRSSSVLSRRPESNSGARECVRTTADWQPLNVRPSVPQRALRRQVLMSTTKPQKE
jgi:hypothetical protein